MKVEDVVPPGQHKHDSHVPEVDAIGFSLWRVMNHLDEVGDYFAALESCPEKAAEQIRQENAFLKSSQNQATQAIERLAALLFAGYGIDSQKRINELLKRRFEQLDPNDQRHTPGPKSTLDG